MRQNSSLLSNQIGILTSWEGLFSIFELAGKSSGTSPNFTYSVRDYKEHIDTEITSQLNNKQLTISQQEFDLLYHTYEDLGITLDYWSHSYPLSIRTFKHPEHYYSEILFVKQNRYESNSNRRMFKIFQYFMNIADQYY